MNARNIISKNSVSSKLTQFYETHEWRLYASGDGSLKTCWRNIAYRVSKNMAYLFDLYCLVRMVSTYQDC